MSTRDLVGRPLVPFFDADDNVNDALATDASLSFESMDVDARVWNKELGYFEYPSDQTASSSDGSAASNQRSTSASRRGKGASAPIAIQSKKTTQSAQQQQTQSTQIDGNGSYGSANRMLLTPAMMLSSSLPDATSLAIERDPMLQQQQQQQQQQQHSDMSANTRSVSAKRASKQEKGRSNTPARRRNNSKQADDSRNTAGNDQAANGKEGKTSGRRGRNKNKENGGGQQQKSKEELSASSGKWAWSAFQSSPDPKQLPLPPFLAPPAFDGAASAPQPPPLPHDSSGPPLGKLDFSSPGHHERPPAPTTPPEAPQQQSMSIELSMTKDLCRMLNIGGG